MEKLSSRTRAHGLKMIRRSQPNLVCRPPLADAQAGGGCRARGWPPLATGRRPCTRGANVPAWRLDDFCSRSARVAQDWVPTTSFLPTIADRNVTKQGWAYLFPDARHLDRLGETQDRPRSQAPHFPSRDGFSRRVSNMHSIGKTNGYRKASSIQFRPWCCRSRPPSSASCGCAPAEPGPYPKEDFLGIWYGFRPGRGQHDALDALVVGIGSTKVNWILDSDIRSFSDHAC